MTIGTWDFQIVDALAPALRHPHPADTGIASNVCVESTLRDAYFHEYWPVMIDRGGGGTRIGR